MQDVLETDALGIRRQTLVSYGGVSVRTDVCVPTDEAALARCLRYASAHGRRISFRSGGRAFDTQSLNDDLVIVLEALASIRMDADDATVTVGPGARWGNILRATSLEGFVPYVMVTGSQAAAGGTVSADSVSRFTPSCGTEGSHVVSLRFMRLDGTVIRCSPSENAETFCALVGGLGYLGAVVEITYALVRLGFRAPRIAIETELEPFRGLDALDHAMAGVQPTKDGEPPRALSAVVHLGDEVGFVMRSRYVDRAPEEHVPSDMHRPNSTVHAVLQALASFELGRRVGWKVFVAWMLREPRVFVDELMGYTFFQDGNERVKRFGRAWGLPFGARQQSFFVPPHTLQGFLTETRTCLETFGVTPALVDVLPIPARLSPSLLSSSRGEPGFLVTVSFEHAMRRRFDREEDALRALVRITERIGGRVHLMKHVYADADVVARMYPAIETIRKRKAVLDPKQSLDNAFLQRVLPGLSTRVVPREERTRGFAR